MNENDVIETEQTVYPEADAREIETAISEARNTLIITHVNPDGDCIGSAYALALIANAFGGKTTVAVNGDVPKRLQFLTDERVNTVTSVSQISVEDYDLILAIDVASPVQLGEYEPLIPYIGFMIDHHGMGEPFAKHFIDPNASAAGEIVFDFYCNMKAEGLIRNITDAARRAYAAIVSDTGSFKFSNTTFVTHTCAAYLLAEINADAAETGGMDTSDICRTLFGRRSLHEVYAQMYAIKNLRFFADGRLAAVVFTRAMLDEYGLTEEDIGNAVETPRGIEGVDVGMSIRQLESLTEFKVSTRANVDVDCAAVCAKFGGGGHTRAAGCTLVCESAEEALDTMVREFTEVLGVQG